MELPGIILDISSISPLRKPDHYTVYDMLILGGVPAAMSAVIYAARKMINLTVITMDFGGGNSAFTAAIDLLRLNAGATFVNFVSGWQWVRCPRWILPGKY